MRDFSRELVDLGNFVSRIKFYLASDLKRPFRTCSELLRFATTVDNAICWGDRLKMF